MQDLDAGPFWAVLWRHRVDTSVLYDHSRA